MKTQTALLALAAASVATFGLLMTNPAYAEHPITNPLTRFLSGSQSAAPAIIPVAQSYRGTARGGRTWNGVYGSHLGINPDYGTYKTYGPFYDQTGGYYGSISQYCDWNGLYPFCYGETDNFYLGR